MRLKTVVLCAALLFTAVGAQAATIADGRVTTSSGVTIHYLQAGPRDSPHALVLIPGWRLPAWLWTEQLNTFSQSRRVIAIDPRSQGESTKTTQGKSPETRAADLHDVLTNLKISKPVLVGWSQGAQDVAAYVAAYGSDLVAGVVFVDSPASIGPAEIEKHPEFSKAILSGMSIYAAHPREYSQGMLKSIFEQPHPEIDMNKLVDFTLQTPTDIGVAMLAMDIFGADRNSALAKFTKPALVIASASSPLLDLQKQMAASMPKAPFVEIKGAGHAVFVDQPAAFDKALSEFLASLGR